MRLRVEQALDAAKHQCTIRLEEVCPELGSHLCPHASSTKDTLTHLEEVELSTLEWALS